ncbi:protein FAM228B isoform X1 [Magallana gigas]|uniref:protein FAM228B isoform X1 n=1 Tax=Magallana gigas TaxID=29159 RepID=UPI00148ACFE9|nr:protein FAM228B isoform X1 [Crassostrea gigas]XP_034331837.1 protein FAM228B isoform X1 [Crassostrea gigas]XP_034331838.1 protein FAM228B isoform X1 [Crassostrea gigas]XP_034331839.1 protein FAM228B isoform X1 [Crassostrea gigas]XP_034331840.1 protein FAM228B isoform X1 [Crassostrea gigas]XP_034331841.1 protein FAM228B isoform X1 [Crassostrea gigas]
MASLLCVKQPGGKVSVHSSDVVDELMIDSKDHIRTMKMNKSDVYRKRTRRPMSTSVIQSKVDSKSLIGQTLRVQDWLNEKTVKGLQFDIPQAWVEKQIVNSTYLKERSDVETKEARELYNPLLEVENTFVRDMENVVSSKEVLDLRKKEMLHKKWNDRVYEPLREKIIDVMDGEDWPELDRRKRELHKQYLEFVNEKGHVFLDTMDPSEYYAQALNGHRPAPIKVYFSEKKHSCLKWSKHMAAAKRRFDHQHYKIATKAFRDPLLSQGRERSAEERTILRCLTGNDYTDKDIEQVKLPPLPLVPLGRQGTDSVRWLEMPLHNIESTPRMASRRRMHGTFNQSQLDFELWSKAQRDRAQVEIEMQTQKKRMYKEIPPFKIPPREIPSSYLEPKNVGIQTIPEEFEQLTLKNWVPSNESASIPVMAS